MLLRVYRLLHHWNATGPGPSLCYYGSIGCYTTGTLRRPELMLLRVTSLERYACPSLCHYGSIGCYITGTLHRPELMLLRVYRLLHHWNATQARAYATTGLSVVTPLERYAGPSLCYYGSIGCYITGTLRRPELMLLRVYRLLHHWNATQARAYATTGLSVVTPLERYAGPSLCYYGSIGCYTTGTLRRPELMLLRVYRLLHHWNATQARAYATTGLSVVTSLERYAGPSLCYYGSIGCYTTGTLRRPELMLLRVYRLLHHWNATQARAYATTDLSVVTPLERYAGQSLCYYGSIGCYTTGTLRRPELMLLRVYRLLHITGTLRRPELMPLWVYRLLHHWNATQARAYATTGLSVVTPLERYACPSLCYYRVYRLLHITGTLRMPELMLLRVYRLLHHWNATQARAYATMGLSVVTPLERYACPSLCYYGSIGCYITGTLRMPELMPLWVYRLLHHWNATHARAYATTGLSVVTSLERYACPSLCHYGSIGCYITGTLRRPELMLLRVYRLLHHWNATQARAYATTGLSVVTPLERYAGPSLCYYGSIGCYTTGTLRRPELMLLRVYRLLHHWNATQARAYATTGLSVVTPLERYAGPSLCYYGSIGCYTTGTLRRPELMLLRVYRLLHHWNATQARAYATTGLSVVTPLERYAGPSLCYYGSIGCYTTLERYGCYITGPSLRYYGSIGCYTTGTLRRPELMLLWVYRLLHHWNATQARAYATTGLSVVTPLERYTGPSLCYYGSIGCYTTGTLHRPELMLLRVYRLLHHWNATQARAYATTGLSVVTSLERYAGPSLCYYGSIGCYTTGTLRRPELMLLRVYRLLHHWNATHVRAYATTGLSVVTPLERYAGPSLCYYGSIGCYTTGTLRRPELMLLRVYRLLHHWNATQARAYATTGLSVVTPLERYAGPSLCYYGSIGCYTTGTLRRPELMLLRVYRLLHHWNATHVRAYATTGLSVVTPLERYAGPSLCYYGSIGCYTTGTLRRPELMLLRVYRLLHHWNATQARAYATTGLSVVTPLERYAGPSLCYYGSIGCYTTGTLRRPELMLLRVYRLLHHWNATHARAYATTGLSVVTPLDRYAGPSLCYYGSIGCYTTGTLRRPELMLLRVYRLLHHWNATQARAYATTGLSVVTPLERYAGPSLCYYGSIGCYTTGTLRRPELMLLRVYRLLHHWNATQARAYATTGLSVVTPLERYAGPSLCYYGSIGCYTTGTLRRPELMLLRVYRLLHHWNATQARAYATTGLSVVTPLERYAGPSLCYYGSIGCYTTGTLRRPELMLLRVYRLLHHWNATQARAYATTGLSVVTPLERYAGPSLCYYGSIGCYTTGTLRRPELMLLRVYRLLHHWNATQARAYATTGLSVVTPLERYTGPSLCYYGSIGCYTTGTLRMSELMLLRVYRLLHHWNATQARAYATTGLSVVTPLERYAGPSLCYYRSIGCYTTGTLRRPELMLLRVYRLLHHWNATQARAYATTDLSVVTPLERYAGPSLCYYRSIGCYTTGTLRRLRAYATTGLSVVTPLERYACPSLCYYGFIGCYTTGSLRRPELMLLRVYRLLHHWNATQARAYATTGLSVVTPLERYAGPSLCYYGSIGCYTTGTLRRPELMLLRVYRLLHHWNATHARAYATTGLSVVTPLERYACPSLRYYGSIGCYTTGTLRMPELTLLRVYRLLHHWNATHARAYATTGLSVVTPLERYAGPSLCYYESIGCYITGTLRRPELTLLGLRSVPVM